MVGQCVLNRTWHTKSKSSETAIDLNIVDTLLQQMHPNAGPTAPGIYIYIRMSFTIKTLFNLPSEATLSCSSWKALPALHQCAAGPESFPKHIPLSRVSCESCVRSPTPTGRQPWEMSVSTSLIESTVHFYTQKSAT